MFSLAHKKFSVNTCVCHIYLLSSTHHDTKGVARMGMDVYGKNPANEAGEYFRRNVWGWRPLWEYVDNQHPEIAELVEHGYDNSGDGLNAEKSLVLANLLEQDLASGRAQDYIELRNKTLASLPMDDCELCEATGIRTDKIGVEHLMPERELRPEVASIVGRDKGWCNGCNGVGKKQNFLTSYYLDHEDLEEFAQFLRGCGGFEIC